MAFLNDEHLKTHKNGEVFIETGTYMGRTLEWVQNMNYFKEIHSIELDHWLAERAKKELAKEGTTIHEGDSIDVLTELIPLMTEKPCTFWLDAHASGVLPGGKSGGGPVVDELNIILQSGRKDHTIFIDDRRLFGSGEWGGVKEADALALLNQINPDYKILYLEGTGGSEDIICATVKE